MNKIIVGFLAVITLGFSALTMAEDAVVQLSTIDGSNTPDSDSVVGARLSVLHGKTSNVKGLDISLLAISETDNVKGLQLGIIAGANHVNESMKGVALGLWNWNKGQATGLNFGAVNLTNDVKGGNIGFVNYSEGSTMFDLSAVNLSQKSNVQVGFFNKTEKLDGLQIGFINCAKNGFLPCFILFNFSE